MIYLDTSAAVKVLIVEEQTQEMRDLFGGTEPLVSSRLLELELAVALQRRGGEEERVSRVLSRISLFTLDDGVLAKALEARSGLRALDALHLATALQLEGIVDSMLSFDRELVQRAQAAGIPPHPLCA
ncbi:type II toxin-antitoxin system VapC family toxin [Microbacterium azadirachtae]|uniref:Ribonuclease VapC n=1 Tax=Microbacterium azadirachtae TaxID=582680 RepID=A0A0F0LSP6_9MICO|nr:type II toxin-antitoxin system VapC family toxin [Microbacterium azadirachtae]KJL34536.1 Ribonuclease VapC47 [Microbacterium azadirachtae]